MRLWPTVIVEADEEAAELRKRAETRLDGQRLSDEARVLAVARHPGVVELLGFDGTTLRLRLAAGSAPPDARSWAAALATTVADLHDIGVVHGAIAAEHVVFDRSGAPVLCGFGQARAGVAARAPEVRADVAALVGLICAAIDDDTRNQLLRHGARGSSRRHPPSARHLAATLSASPSPDRRTPTRGRAVVPAASMSPGRRTQARGRAVVPAASVSPGRRTQARSRAVVPAASLSADRATPTHGRVLVAGAALAGTALVLSTTMRAALSASTATRTSPTAALSATTATRTSPTAALSATTATQNAPTGNRTVAVASCPVVDQGCRPLASADRVVVVASRRYRVGDAGDVVVLGRWWCRAALPAVLEPGAGDVWVFDSWAAPGAVERARLVAHVPGAQSLEVDPGPGGCDRLRVTVDHGVSVGVLPGAAP